MDEIWKDITGYEGLYQVSNLGRVKSLKFGKELILKHSKDKDGYVMVGLWKNNHNTTAKVHRLVAQAFIPNPENKPQVNHLKGIRNDNRVTELEWATKSEDAIHSWNVLKREKPNLFGCKNPRSLFTEKQVRIIRHAHYWGTSQTDLGKIFGTSQQVISRIVRRKTYADLK